MPIADRAAQFSPFAALAGHEDAVREAGRFVEERAPLGEAERAELDRTLARIRASLAERPFVTITHFVPDTLKEGGTYARYEGRVRTFDEVGQALILEDGTRIPLDAIESIRTYP